MSNDITAIMKEHVARLEKELDTMCSQFQFEKPSTNKTQNYTVSLPLELIGKIKGAVIQGKIHNANETISHVLNGFIKQLEKEGGAIEPVDPKINLMRYLYKREGAAKKKKMYTMIKNMARQIRQLKEMYLEGE